MTLSSFLSPRHTTRGPFPASQAWVWLLDLHWLKRWKWVCHWVQALKSRDWFAILFSRSKVTLVHPPPIPWSDNLTEEIPGADLRHMAGIAVPIYKTGTITTSYDRREVGRRLHHLPRSLCYSGVEPRSSHYQWEISSPRWPHPVCPGRHVGRVKGTEALSLDWPRSNTNFGVFQGVSVGNNNSLSYKFMGRVI